MTFVSAFHPKIEEKQVVSVFRGNVSFAANMTTLNSLLTEALSNFNEINFNVFVKGGERPVEHG